MSKSKDPEWGLRSGWVERSRLKFGGDLDSMDLSVTAATPPDHRPPEVPARERSAMTGKRSVWLDRGWGKVLILAVPDGKQRGEDVASHVWSIEEIVALLL